MNGLENLSPDLSGALGVLAQTESPGILGGPLGLLLVFLLVLLNGYFVAAEFALVSVRKTQIDELASKGSRAARGVQRALKHLDTYIAATQLGITMASLALGFVGEPAIAHLLEPLFVRLGLPAQGTFSSRAISVGVAFAIATALHIVFGELAPKSIALQRPDRTALWVTAPLNIFLRVFKPFILGLNALGNLVVRPLGLRSVSEHASVHSVSELELLVHSTAEAGLLQEQQEQMVAGVFDFGEVIVRKVMTPRLDITALDVEATTEELLKVVTESGHSRIPVYEETLDNIVGVIHVKDVLKDVADGTMDASIRELMRPPYVVPENKKAGALLAELRRGKVQMAVVQDEYGTVAGIVTIEDLLEEIVGDILDEYDVEEAPIQQIDENAWLCEGKFQVEDFNDRAGADLPTEAADTLGGLVFNAAGHQPRNGEVVEVEGWRFRVEATDGRRIQKVRVTRLPRPHAGDPQDAQDTAER